MKGGDLDERHAEAELEAPAVCGRRPGDADRQHRGLAPALSPPDRPPTYRTRERIERP